MPVGGGGLIAGIAAYIKALKPGIKVRRRKREAGHGVGFVSLSVE